MKLGHPNHLLQLRYLYQHRIKSHVSVSDRLQSTAYCLATIKAFRSTNSRIINTSRKINGAAVVVQDAMVSRFSRSIESRREEQSELETDRLRKAIEVSRKDFEEGRFRDLYKERSAACSTKFCWKDGGEKWA
jgi:hypothetical protein